MMEWIANTLENALDFSNILNASIAASWLVLAVMILRFLLKKAPKWTHVALWGLVAARLLLPFSMESAFSLIPSNETLPREILTSEGNQLKESAYLEVISNPTYSEDVTVVLDQSVDRVQVHMIDMTFIWLAGIAGLLLYTAISYWYLHRRINTAVVLRDNIFQSENVRSPFVLGIFRPRIYLSFRIEGQELEHVVAHEQAHIHRKDHWWKPLGFLLLTIHWFNPLMWVAFILLRRDIELACDEKVIKELNNEQRADYTQALVSCSVNRRMIAACPLTFGEVGVKERVKSVMNYKKPTCRMITLAVVAGVVVAVCFLTNPKEASVYDIFSQDGYTIMDQKQIELTLIIPKSELPDAIYTSEGYEFEKGKVVAYRTDTTTIYLRKAMLSNESDEQLYFIFDCDYDLANYGSFDSSWYVDEKHDGTSDELSLRSKDLRDSSGTYQDALSIRGYGPGTQFAFYVWKDACMSAKEKIMIDIQCNRISYARAGYEEEAAQLISSNEFDQAETSVVDMNATIVMTPTTAAMTGVFDRYLYIPLEGGTYRYEYTEVDAEKVTAYNLLYSFIEKAEPKDVEWKVYSLREYPKLSAVLAVAGEDYTCVYQYSPSKRSNPDALTQAMEDGCVIHMDGDVTNGQDIWQAFVDATTAGKTASVQMAYYYTLDKEHCSEQYYEAYQEDYPVLYRQDLTYDGDCYTLKWKAGNTEYVRDYQYLMYYTGDAPTPHATYDSFSRYVLINDNKVTWEDIQRGLYSSQIEDYINHYSVYADLQ